MPLITLEVEKDGKWLPVETTDTLSTVGYKRIVRFKTTPADALRIHFTEQKARYVLIMWKPSWLPAVGTAAYRAKCEK